MATNATSIQTREVTPLEITIGIGTDEIKEIIMEHMFENDVKVYGT